MKRVLRIHLFLLVCIVLSLTVAFAGSTGKIMGKVTDATTGDALIGVNVTVVSTLLGATTDVNGNYAIIGVQIGTVSVRAFILGYQEVMVKEVKVSADQTTPVNFKLSSQVLNTGKEVVITADRLVNPLTTSSVQTVSSQQISQIPNVKSVSDVVALQAGVVSKNGQLFLRGGRANEVQYVVDGIPVNNLTGSSGDLTTANVNSQLQNLYSGSQTGSIGGGSSGLAVSADAIQTLSVQTSGFDADYGNSQSGIVNIVTKSGGEHYSVSTQYRTDKVANTNQNETYGSFNLGGPEPITKYLLPQLGLSIPGNVTFFLSSDVNRKDGPYNYARNEFYNPLERKIQFQGFLGGILNGLGFRYTDNQTNAFTLNSKLKYDISGKDQISYSYRASLGSGHDYAEVWKYRADSSRVSTNLSTQHVFSWTHFFGQNTFSRLYMGRVENNNDNNVAGLSPAQYSIAASGQDINKDNFNDLGTSQSWKSGSNVTWTARLDFNSQVHPLHLLKTGFEFNYEEVKSTEINYPTVPISVNGVTIYPPFSDSLRSSLPGYHEYGLYPGYGLYRWVLNNYPNRGAAYIQDNIEFEGLNLHVGLRYDYLDIGKQVYDPQFEKAWLRAVNASQSNQSNTLFTTVPWADRISGGSTFMYYVLHGYFSPRLSIGYPVTDRIVFYFNYGHFLQFPERDDYYRDPFLLGASNNWIGNPALKPQRTVQYESGFENQISDDMAFAIRAYYKDIFDYATLTSTSNGINRLFVNLDYASARGFEVTLSRSFSGNFSANATYTYQIAKGRSSNPLASVFSPQFQLPRETRLDWDQEHTANLFVRYNVGPKEEGSFFGLPFINNWGMSLKWQFGSGFPYTIYRGRITDRNVLFVNDGTMPYTSEVGLSIYKGFYILDRINAVATLDVENLFNRRNVNSVYDFTGRPAQYGDYDPDTRTVINWYQTGYRVDPTLFGAGRQIFLGIRLNWE